MREAGVLVTRGMIFAASIDCMQGKWTISVSWLAVARKETLDNGQAIETTPFVPPILSAPWMATLKPYGLDHLGT